jgi:hypothetical protein
MDPHWRHPYGLRPTIRHLMLLVLDVALLSALVRLLEYGLYAGLIVVFPLSPLLLSVLVVVFDRPSPAKYWLAGLLILLFLPSVAVSLDVLAAVNWWHIRDSRGIEFLLVLMNVIGVVSLIRTAWRLPRRCPECGLCAWLPLGRRSAALFWCASCGFGERAGRPQATH